MLIKFEVANFRSLREPQVFSLVATALKDYGTDLMEVEALGEKLLPCAALYGANASGKSNAIHALGYIRHFILNSHVRQKPDEPIDPPRFRLDAVSKTLPARFEIDFIVDQVRYQFGVEMNEKEVMVEYLYAYPNRRRQTWYERRGGDYSFGKTLRGENRTIQSVTRANSLFLSAAATLNHEQLSPLYRYFREGFIISYQVASIPPALKETLENPERKQKLLALMQAADVGICDIVQGTRHPTEEDRQFMSELRGVLRKYTGSELPEDIDGAEDSFRQAPEFSHVGAHERVLLHLFEESRGTQRLLALLVPTLDALEHGKVLIIDELDNSLHPLLARRLISLFQSRGSNPNQAQLIFTTHDTNLLTRSLLRRDQIWFAAKDRTGATTIYPLSDIKTRATDNIERGYLDGRYGAIPFLNDFDELTK